MIGPHSAPSGASILETPPLPLIVSADVFPGFGACESSVLEWRRPTAGRFAVWDEAPLDGSDPARMVFVFRRPCDFLPAELARLHAFGLGLDGEMALAPYAIDDATDSFFERRDEGVRPADYLFLAADNLNALFWGLHDWSHFHNHGPFTERANTELQCDTAALAWIWINRPAIPIDERRWRELCAEVRALGAARYLAEGRADEGLEWPADRVIELATSLRCS